MAVRALATRASCSRSAPDSGIASKAFWISEMRALVAARSAWKACSTAFSLLSSSASVRTEFTSVCASKLAASCWRRAVSCSTASALTWDCAER